MTHCVDIKYSSPYCVKFEICIELLQRRLVSTMYEATGMTRKNIESMCTMAGIGLKRCFGADPSWVEFLVKYPPFS